MSAEPEAVLLDTNAALWMIADSRRLSPRALQIVVASSARLIVSATSLWELAIKRSLGKLSAPTDLSRRLAAMRQVELLPISPLHAEAVGELPWHHRDPFDRLLVAQAHSERLPIVSPDRVLAQYSVEVVW